MTQRSNLVRASLAAALSFTFSAQAMAASDPAAVAKRLTELGIKDYNKNFTPEKVAKAYSITFDGKKSKPFTDADCVLVGGLENLRSVTFINTRVSKSCLEGIAQLPQLNVLTLAISEVDGAGLAALKPKDNLRDLTLSDVQGVTPAHLGVLKEFGASSLKLVLQNNRKKKSFGDDHVAAIGGAKAIIELHISVVPFSEKGGAAAGALPRLNTLKLFDTDSGDKALLPLLSSASGLKKLEFNDDKATTKVLPAIAAMQNLEDLKLEGNRINGGFAAFKGHQKLKRFAFQLKKVTPEDYAALAHMPALRDVRVLFGPGFTDAHAEALSAATQLTTVYTQQTKHLTDTGAMHLASLTSLENLDFSRAPQVGDATAKAIAGLPLKKLGMSYTGLTDKALMELVKMPTLQNLYVAKSQVTKDGIAKAKAAAANPKLRIR